MDPINDTSKDTSEITSKKRYTSTEASRASKLKYYHKNKEEIDRKRYELYLQQKDTPEYREIIKKSQRKYYLKKKLEKQLKSSSSNSSTTASNSDKEV